MKYDGAFIMAAAWIAASAPARAQSTSHAPGSIGAYNAFGASPYNTISYTNNTTTYAQTEPPSHFKVHDQYFDATVGGLRDYLESIRSSEPALYDRLDPKVSELESRQATGIAALAIGAGVGAVSILYAFVGRKDCAMPSISDPNFDSKSNAWSQCNDDNAHTTITFISVGLGATLVGAIGWLILSPGRSDFLEFVNEHNRLSPEPLHWELGYDPSRRVAFGSASLSF